MQAFTVFPCIIVASEFIDYRWAYAPELVFRADLGCEWPTNFSARADNAKFHTGRRNSGENRRRPHWVDDNHQSDQLSGKLSKGRRAIVDDVDMHSTLRLSSYRQRCNLPHP